MPNPISFAKTKSVKIPVRCHVCDVEFMGYPNSKFCKKHKKAKSEVRKIENMENGWIPFENKFNKTTNIQRECDLCGKLYDYTIYMDTKEIPKYCEEHRQEYRRKIYLMNKVI